MKDLNQINSYLLKKKEQIIIEKTSEDILSSKVNPNIVLGMLANLDTWGYTVDKKLLPKLFNLSENTFVHSFYEPLVNTLKEIKGDDVSYDNMLFKNFPDSCRAIDHEQLSNMRFVGYFTGIIDAYIGTNLTNEIPWDGKKQERKDATPISAERLRIISEGTLEDFETMLKNLLSSRAALSPFDKEIVEFALKSDDVPNETIIPDEIPYKENWAYLFKFAFNNPGLNIPMTFKNFNDFVRACVALSNGDVSLAEKPKLRSFKNQERKQLLTLLNEGARKYPEAMKESLITPTNKRFVDQVLIRGWHINKDHKNRVLNFNRIYQEALHSKSKRSMIETAMGQGRYIDAAKYALSVSQGELARRANSLLTLCKSSDEKKIAEIIGQNIDKVSIQVLLNLKNTLLHTNKNEIKVAFPKGMTAYAHAFENKRAAGKTINPLVESYLIESINKSIIAQLKNNKVLGKVYIDERLKNCPVPFAARNQNGENRCAERGTSFEMKPGTKTIRAFCYKEIHENPNFVDVSVSFLDKQFNLKEQCSWTNLQTNEAHPMAVHSGDNPNCANGLAEFIDIDLEQLKEVAKEKDIKYAAFHVLSWAHIPFAEMDRCFFGVMERESVASDKVTKEDMSKLIEAGYNRCDLNKLNSHHSLYYYHLPKEALELLGYKQEKVFDPASVEYRNDIKAKATTNIPMIYDVENERFIITDLECKSPSPFIPAKEISNSLFKATGNGVLSVENLAGAAAQACYAIVNMEKPNMYDLAMYNIEARNGEITDKIEEADTIFTMTKDNLPETKEDAEIITIYDRDVITADLLMENKEKEVIEREDR